ncbi:MAG: NUDIX hydrolase [Gammaproteobacteria bacterium]|nr:NUDIX hydrolase [Gammaproteobacteria bacterium]
MNFCVKCGANTVYKVPPGDNQQRFVCRLCGHIHYENPKIVCGCLVRSNDQVLLCKRGIEPRKDRWTFPAGFLERHESTLEGAKRETREEACADVELDMLYAQFDLAYISQIYQFYLADLIGSYAPGDETLDVQLFDEETIPWEQLAFPVIRKSLESYFSDRARGRYTFRHFEIPDRSSWTSI